MNTHRKKNTEKNTSSFIVNLAEVKLPEVDLGRVRTSTTDWVTYGSKNDFPEQLVNFVKKSTTHQSLVNKRQELIASEGFSYSENIAEFLENLDEEGNTIDDLISNVATDLSILETFAVAVRYNKLKNQIVALDYIDSSTVRPDKNLDELGRIQGYWVCPDWNQYQLNTPVYFERFNPNEVNETTQLFFYHKRDLLQPYLPTVSYISALNYIELAYELSKFGLSTVLNGFFGSAILQAKASMSDEQKQEFERNVKASFTGSDNASKLMVVVTEEDDSVKVTPLSTTDNTAMLKALKDMVIAEVCSAHKANPIIAAIQADTSTLGSDGKLYRDSLEIYYNTVIRKLQIPFVEFLNKVLKFNGNKDYELEITSSALLASSLPIEYKADYLKPEVWLAEFGYTKEDIKPELLEAIDEAESGEEIEKIIEEDKSDVADAA